MKEMITNSIPVEILQKDELPKISEKHDFIAGIVIGKKLFCLLEFRKFTEKNTIKIVNTPSFICYDKERKDENIGKPLSKRDFDDQLSIFFTKKQIKNINDALYPDFPKTKKTKKK